VASALAQENLQACQANTLDRRTLAIAPESSAARDAAMALMSQYGEDAEVIATLRAAEVAAMGDVDALAHWDAVIAFIESGPDSANLN
jgi:hypothetical protein